MDSVTSSALPGHEPAASGRFGPTLRIDLLLRPWVSASASPTGQSNPQPGLVALIEDVVAPRGGILVLAKDLMYVSGFEHTAEALVATRQIQIAVQGFRRRHPSVPMAVSIVMDSSRLAAVEGDTSGSAIADPPHELVSLLSISKPAQILLTHDAFQQLSSSDGIPLKPFPGRFGVHEYLWIGDDQLDVLQSEPQLTLAVITRDTPAFSPAPAPVAEPVSSSTTFTAPPAQTPLGRRTALSEQALISQWPAPLRSPRVWVMAGVPIVVVLMILGIVVSRRPSQTPKTASSGAIHLNPAASSTSPASVPRASASATSASSSADPASHAPPAQTAAAKPLAGPNSKKQPRSPDTVPAAPAAPAPSRQCEAGNLQQLIALAKQNRQLANYEAAKRQFEMVLACDPKNAEAKSGLDRTLLDEQMHPDQ